MFPVLDKISKVCRHNLQFLHAEPLLVVADHNAGEHGLVLPPGHVPGGDAPGAVHDEVDSRRAAACWQAWQRQASLLQPREGHSMVFAMHRHVRVKRSGQSQVPSVSSGEPH
jgi:hypothetical protein